MKEKNITDFNAIGIVLSAGIENTQNIWQYYNTLKGIPKKHFGIEYIEKADNQICTLHRVRARIV